MDLKPRHIEVIMKGFALCLTGLALLAAGCAQNRNLDPEIAPSRQASRLTSGSGWSVPPGQNRVTRPAAVQETSREDGKLTNGAPAKGALTARSENDRKGSAAPGQTMRRDGNPRRDGNQPASTMGRESDSRRDPFKSRKADRRTPAILPPPAAFAAGKQRAPDPGDRARVDAGKGEAAGGNERPRGVERDSLVDSRAVRTVPALVASLVKPREERPVLDANPDPRNEAQSPGKEKAADWTRPGRINAGRDLRENAARVDGPNRRPGTAPPIRRAAPLVRAIPVRVARKEATALQTVRFDFDSVKLSAEAERVLDQNARWLLDHPGIVVRVEGHADERGTSEYNLTLGAHRARKVRDFLISRGVSPKNLVTVSFGEELPLDTGSEPESWARNRRTEFGLVNGGEVAAMTFGRRARRSIR